MRAALATIDITPPVGIWMSGYGGRTASESLTDPLYVQALAVEDDAGLRAVIAAGDLLGFDHDFVATARTEIHRRCGLGAEAVLLGASHTHGGPAFINHFATEAPHCDAGYRQRVLESVLSAVERALGDLAAVDGYYAMGHCRVGVNRREPRPPYGMAPNPRGFYDDTVGVLAFCQPGTRRPVAVLFNACCHPTTLGAATTLTADWPGAARQAISAWLGAEHAAIFLQGGCGNIRPRTIEPGGNRFRQGTLADLAREGQACAHEVIRLLQDELTPFGKTLTAHRVTFELPLENVPTPAELAAWRDGSDVFDRALAEFAEQRWPDGNLPASLPYEVQKLDFGGVVSLVAMPGEVVNEIGWATRQIVGHPTLFAGYANGSPCYIPTARIRRQGGYEGGDRNLHIYGWAGGLHPDCERLILDAVSRLCGEW